MKENSYDFANPEVNPEKWLYHYTSFETAIKYILPTGTLKIGEYGKVNDPKEAKLNPSMLNIGNSPSDGDELEEFLNKCQNICSQIFDYFSHRIRIICFSVGDSRYEKTLSSHFATGYCKPRMWAQYGDTNKGVCLIFDKSILEEQIITQLETKGEIYFGNVKYESCEFIDGSWKLQNCINSESIKFPMQNLQDDFEATIRQQIKNYKDSYFFHKHEDWKAETEYRYVFHGDEVGDIFFNYGDALSGIVVGTEFPEYHEKALTDVAESSDISVIKIDWGIGGFKQKPLGSVGLGTIHFTIPNTTKD